MSGLILKMSKAENISPSCGQYFIYFLLRYNELVLVSWAFELEPYHGRSEFNFFCERDGLLVSLIKQFAQFHIWKTIWLGCFFSHVKILCVKNEVWKLPKPKKIQFQGFRDLLFTKSVEFRECDFSFGFTDSLILCL